MTRRQFACLNCKQYIDAGGRWCYAHLERTGIVMPGSTLNAERVLATAEYWAISGAGQNLSTWLDSLPPQLEALVSPFVHTSPAWLEKLLPQVETFLLLHRNHELRFGAGADEHFYSDNDFLEWDDVELGEAFDVSVKSLYAKGCREWVDVELYMKSRETPVWWWDQPETMEDARRRFAAYVIRPKLQPPSPCP